MLPVLLALCVLLPSAAKVHRILGGAGVCAYLVVAGALLLPFPALYQRAGWIPPDRAIVAFGAMLAGLCLVIALVHPHVTAGSDRDEALDAATAALLHGRDPYAPDVFPKPISPMPGELVFALPFALLAPSAAWQTIYWFAAFFVLAGAGLRSFGRALCFLVTLLALAPVVMHELATGGDLLANALWVLVLGALAVDRDSRIVRAAALLFGVGLSSRLLFLAVLPLLFVAMRARGGRRVALERLALALAGFAGVTLPFLVGGRPFSPLHIAGKLEGLHPWALPSTLFASAAAAAAGAVWVARRGAGNCVCLTAAGLVLVAPVLVASAFATAAAGGEGFDAWAWYALAGLPSGALAAAMASERYVTPDGGRVHLTGHRSAQ